MKNIVVIAATIAVLAGCASLRPAPIEAIANLPIVRVGDKPPANAEYVLFYPAGHPFPVRLKAGGSLFSKENEIESQVSLSKNLYLYKYWASHDRITWKNSHELLAVQFGGGFAVSGLEVNVKLEAK